jgi:DNA-binding NtrC family response regulator
VIGVLNTSDDTVELLRMCLEAEGFVVVSAHVQAIRRGAQTLNEALAEHHPEVVIYDLAPPYDRSWLFLQHLKALDASSKWKWVLTSTNPARVRQLHPDSADHQIHEIIGKPYDLREIVNAVKRELGEEDK